MKQFPKPSKQQYEQAFWNTVRALEDNNPDVFIAALPSKFPNEYCTIHIYFNGWLTVVHGDAAYTFQVEDEIAKVNQD